MRKQKLVLLMILTIFGVIGFGIVIKKVNFSELFPRTIGAPTLPSPVAVTPSQKPSLSFIALGDTGKPTRQRESVVKELQSRLPEVPVEFIMLLGDNFYEIGVSSTDDPLWQTQFEKPFSSEVFSMPFYACLGNHDYFGNTQAQIDYGKTHPRWKMPDSYYSFKESSDNLSFTAEFFVLDTNTINLEMDSAPEQIEWLGKALSESTATWKIVTGHHPVLSGGDHGGSKHVRDALVPLFDEFEVDLYMSGHDHDLQLHDLGKDWLQLVSGAGSKLRTVRWIESTLFAEATPGFAGVTLTEDNLKIEIIASNGLRFVHDVVKRTALHSTPD